jgi:hypothetical protein
MSATLTTKLSILINAALRNTVGSAAADALIDTVNQFNWASGVIADAADKVYSVSITRTHASPTGDLDLAGVLTDAFGVTLTLARIKALFVIADAANVNSVVVGGGSAAPITTLFFDYVATVAAQPALKVRPGGMLSLIAPQATAYAVTATTADKLQIANGDEDGTTSVTATVIIIGASA